jgi:dolichol-phosphate mannosyltransferase
MQIEELPATNYSQPVTRRRCDPAVVHLGIVCPMANERETAAEFVTTLLEKCAEYDFGEISLFIVLDRKSTDGTRETLEGMAKLEPQLNVVWAPENRCAVDAYLRGYREAIGAQCDWILEIDGGYSHQPDDLPAFFEKMAQGYDCVFGSRFCPGGKITETSWKRKILSGGGTFLANLLLGTRLRDMTSGYQLFTRRALERVLARGIRSRGHFFQTEMKAYCRHLAVAEVPIHYRSASASVNGAVVKDAFVNLWRLFRMRLAGDL